MQVRFIMACLFLMPMALWADQAVEQYDPVKFEKRFHKADVDKNGKLSRKEAYAEFPRMPDFFDEIDSNKDNFITLGEVNQAAQRRVDAAMKALDAKQAAKPSIGTASKADAVNGQQLMLQSKTEARREYRNQYYEELSAQKARAEQRGEPVPSGLPSTPLIRKEF